MVHTDEKAYITVLTNEHYLIGALVLAKSHSLTNSGIPLYVLVPDTVSDHVIASLKQNDVPYIKTSNLPDTCYKGSGHWKDTMFKLKIFSLTDYDKIVFIDADMILLKNIDFLFDKPHMSAVIAGKELHPEWDGLNSGLMIIEPNYDEYVGLVSLIEASFQDRSAAGLPFGDQDVLEKYYTDWKQCSQLHLPSVYNVLLGYAGVLKEQNIITSIDDVYLYHFTGKQKPWGSFKDNIIVLIKILLRSRHFGVDLAIYRKYRKMQKTITINSQPLAPLE